MREKAYAARFKRLLSVLHYSLEKDAFSLDEGRYPRSSGGETAYALFRVPNARRLVILFHGTGNDLLFTWQPLILSLLLKGQSVLLFDLDGHGRGSTTRLERETFRDAPHDLSRFLKTKGLETYPIALVGYSLGALSILHTQLIETLKADKIVLLALPLRVKITFSFIVHELLSFISADFYRQLLTYGWRETIPAFGRFRRRSFPLRLEERYDGHYPTLVDDLILDHPPLLTLEKLGHNCLVVFGSWDRLAFVTEAWKNTAPEILVIDRANHFLLPFQKRTIASITAWIG